MPLLITPSLQTEFHPCWHCVSFAGMLYQATPAGDIKNTIPPPPAAQDRPAGPMGVRHVYWCEDRMFMAAYAQPLEEGEGVADITFYAITQEKVAAGTLATRYTQLEDPAPAFGNDQRPIAYYQAGLSLPSPLPEGSFDWKHILIYGGVGEEHGQRGGREARLLPAD